MSQDLNRQYMLYFTHSFPWIKPLLEGALANRARWADLEEKVKMGLTWIDYDIIEVPVEEVEVRVSR